MNKTFPLDSFIKIDFLQEIQDKFSRATGLAAVTVDCVGKPITKYSNFTKFCRLIRKNPKWRERCYRCDSYGGIEAARLHKPYVYKCHAGLVDISMPIILNGNYMGAILAGQAKIEKKKYDELNLIMGFMTDWKEDPKIKDAYEEIEVLTYDKVKAAAHMIFVISNYIVEKELINLIQEELNRKNIELMNEVRLRSNLEKSLKESEIKALQSQINPHFLFNVLNTISRLAIFENAKKTQEIAYCFSELLRYTLSKNRKLNVSVKDEISYAENYLKIQKIRFGDRLRYRINIEEDIKNVSVPFIIIQPIVENAVNHGISKLKNGGCIDIRGYREDNDVVLEISDNGVGIDEDKLLDILSDEKDIFEDSLSTGLGLKNVNKRLVHYYGQGYSLDIKSKPHVGTKVKIRIPIEKIPK